MKNFIAWVALNLIMTTTALANPHPTQGMGELEIVNNNGAKTSAVLLDTRISGEVNGLVASIHIKQSFHNQSQEWVHGRYVFPLPAQAAVNQMQVTIGERVIVAEVQEKQQAKRNFAAAKLAGKKAGLLKQHRANLFSMNIANIPPGETITTQLTYIDRVQFDSGVFRLMVPTTLTPRYIPGQPRFIELPVESENSTRPIQLTTRGWAQNTDQVVDASEITPSQTYETPAGSHHFSLDLVVDPGYAVNGLLSPSHHLVNTQQSDHAIHSRLQAGQAALNKDLIIEWQARDAALTQAAVFSQFDGEHYYNMVMLTPPSLGAQTLSRDITFIIDTSGSMAGIPMQQARQSLLSALQDLTTDDRFNVVEFNSRFRPLFPRSRTANTQYRTQAEAMVNNLEANGGTEMHEALEFALKQPDDERFLRQVVFITDGSVGNEQALFSLIDQHLGSARLFTISIGSAPNRYFMRKAATYGRGFYLHIGRLDQVSEKIALLWQKIKRPVLRNLKVDLSAEVEQFPKRLPDLYAGEPVLLLARSQQAIGELTLIGQLGDQTWQQKLRATADNQTAQLNTLWGRAKIESLMDSLVEKPDQLNEVRSQIIQLGTQFNLVSKFTSMIAIEKTVSRPKTVGARQRNIPNVMPQGSSMPAPQTATSARLFQVLGGLLIGLTLLCRCLPGFRWPAEIA